MRRFLGKDGKKTFKPVKEHKNAKAKKVSAITYETLGSGNILEAVRLPSGEDPNDWLAMHLVDFYNEISLLYNLCADDGAERFTKPGEGFPRGVEYRWADGVEIKKPIKCSSPQYVEYVLSWVVAQLNNPKIFPEDVEAQSYPKGFKKYACSMYKRLYRVYAIVYSCHKDVIEAVDAVAHLNTAFKHFMFFVLEFNLVPSQEFACIADITTPLSELYQVKASEAMNDDEGGKGAATGQ